MRTHDRLSTLMPEDGDGKAAPGLEWTRRRLLAALGMAGAAALVGGTVTAAAVKGNGVTVTHSVYGGGEGELNCCFLSGTLADLRASTDPAADGLLYYVTDEGREGFFECDPADTTSPDNTGLTIVTASGARWKRIRPDGRVSVKWFGARGDGIADDMAAIQQAIDVVFAEGGGIVFFPKGTYLVSPSLDTRIQLRSNVDLLGEGGNSVIKVKDNAGDYWTVFGHTNTSVRVENIRISHLRIDQNPQNNPNANIDTKRTDTPYFRQFCIALFNYDNIVVDHVRFDPTCGVNTITINNPACNGVTVTNCYFNFVHAAGDPEYDNSAIYLSGQNHIVANNVFFAAPGEKARGAIETHTGQSVVANNVSDGYFTGVNVVAGSESGENCDITVAGNTISNANAGIQIWPQKTNAITYVTISGNTISLSNSFHQRITTVGISSAGGNTETGYFENITIDGNTIVFEEELTLRSGLQEGFAYGIGFNKETDLTNITVSNNIIKNAPVTGIHFGNTNKIGIIRNLSITGNTIVNAGHYPAVTERFRAGILLRSTVIGAIVANNIISDTYEETKGLYAIRINDQDGTFTDVHVRDNLVRASQGGLWMDLSPSVQVDRAERNLVFAEAFPPAEGTFDAGQVLFVTDPAVQNGKTPVGYKVVGAGTAGVLSGVQATGSSGSYVITVTDASSLRVGQYIWIATGNQVRRIVHISGSKVRLQTALTTDVPSPSAVDFVAPQFQPFGSIGALPAIADTNGSTLSQLEAELNALKQALRDYGILAP